MERLQVTTSNEALRTAVDGLGKASQAAHAARLSYEQATETMRQQGELLRGAKVALTGKLYARNGRALFAEDPEAGVNNLQVLIKSARVCVNEPLSSHQATAPDELPYLLIEGYTTEGDDSFTAYCNSAGVNINVLELAPDAGTVE